jgi:hypothetical protein
MFGPSVNRAGQQVSISASQLFVCRMLRAYGLIARRAYSRV